MVKETFFISSDFGQKVFSDRSLRVSAKVKEDWTFFRVNAWKFLNTKESMLQHIFQI